ncbi:ankyrin [Cadophora sp. DSE1049]|nr:ankyrin [Cadophora sp. DSE1049]
MLVPFYELTNHEGLQFAREKKLDIADIVETLGTSGEGDCTFESATRLGIEIAILLVKLGIFSQDPSPKNVQDAARNSRVGTMRFLLSTGADPISADTDGEAALHLTSNLEIARMLCEAGASIASLDGDGNTTISKAAAYGRIDVLKVLLRQDGAREILDHRNKFGKSAIHYANNKGLALGGQIIKMLVDTGANPDLEIVRST